MTSFPSNVSYRTSRILPHYPIRLPRKHEIKLTSHTFLSTLSLTEISSLPVVHSLKDVVLEIEPRVVHLGASSTLSCGYDLEDAPLYTVKWYRGSHEFYRYTPKEFPSTKIFPFDDLHVDVSI